MVAGVESASGSPDAAPLPVLMQARLAAARVREKQVPVFRWGWEKPTPIPPVPPAVPQNPWRRIAGSVPADADKLRTYKPVIYAPNTIVGGRSRFRKGVVAFGADGLTFSGIGVKPVGWLQKAGCAAYIVLGILFVAHNVSPLRGSALAVPLRWIGGVALITAVFAHTAENIVSEWRRGEQTLFVPWSDCLEAQWERDLRWAVIIFRSYEGNKSDGTATVVHLPLSGLSPAQAAALWEAFYEHAPGRNRISDALTEASPLLWGVALLLAGFVCFLVTFGIWRQTHP